MRADARILAQDLKLILSDDQRMLVDTARKFFAARPAARLKRLRDAGDALGYERVAWRDAAALGLVGAAIAENHGGSGMGFADLALVVEEAGRELAPEPWLGCAVAAAGALSLAGSAAQQAAWLPQIAAGEAVVTWAHDERGRRHARRPAAVTARRDSDGWLLRGTKTHVPDGHSADAWIVSAATGDAPDDVALFVVAADTPGARTMRLNRADLRGVADVTLADVRLGDEARLPGGDAAVLDAVLDRHAIALAAEMLGGAQRAFQITLDYLKTRQQFGVAIGSFQALKHRAVRMFVALALSESLVRAAARTVDDAPAAAPALAAAAKAKMGDCFRLVANEGIQMHGGVGVTDEYDIGLYLKRAQAADATAGDGAAQRRRWAELAGY